MNITKITLSLLFVVTLFTLSACGNQGSSDTNADKSTTVRIGWQPTMNGARYFVATAEKLFEEEGIKVKTVKFTSGPPFYAAFQSGDIDVGFMGSSPTVGGLAQELPVSIFAVENYAKDSEGLVVRPDSGISKLTDLKGKRIGVTRGSSGDFSLHAMMKKVGLTEDDVEIVDLSVTNLMPAFNKGAIDGAVYWEPWQGLMRKAGGRQIATDSDVGVKMAILWLARTEWLDQNPDATQQVLKAIDQATNTIENNPEQAAKHLASGVSVDEDLAFKVITEEASWPTMEEQWKQGYVLSINPKSISQGTGLVDSLNDMSEYQQSVGAVDTPPDIPAAIDTGPLEKYLNEAQ